MSARRKHGMTTEDILREVREGLPVKVDSRAILEQSQLLGPMNDARTTNDAIAHPPSRGATHTRSSQLQAYVCMVLNKASNASAGRARFDALMARAKEACPLAPHRLRAFLGSSPAGVVQPSDARDIAIALNENEFRGGGPTAVTRRQLCNVISNMTSEQVLQASLLIAGIAPQRLLEALDDTQVAAAVPQILETLSNNLGSDNDARSKALLALWPKAAVYAGLWQWYRSDLI